MSTEPLDVSLRVRLRYEAAGTARQVVGDLSQVEAKARQLGSLGDMGRLEAGLKRTDAAATTAARRLAEVREEAARLGSSEAGQRVAAGLKATAEAGAQASREVAGLGQAAARFGATSTVSYLGRDLRAVAAPAGAAKRELGEVREAALRLGATPVGQPAAGLRATAEAGRQAVVTIEAAAQAATKFGAGAPARETARDIRAIARSARAATRELTDLAEVTERLGRGRGPVRLGEDLDLAGRRADELQRRLDAIERRLTGRGLGAGAGYAPRIGRHLEHHAFGNEALAASGLGYGLRFGMGAAGAAGLAAGAGIAATGGALAGATRQAISFETAMAEVKKAVDLTPDGLAEMERTILRISVRTGIAKEKMAELVAEAGYAGLPKEDLARFAEFGAKAAGAFKMTEGETGDRLAKLRTNFGLTQAGIEDVADGINVLADTGSAKERQIIDFLERTSGAGKALRIVPLNLAAMGSAIISTGRASEVAGTGFNALVMKLGMADSQNKEFKEGLRAIRVSARQVKAEMAVRPEETILGVLERINKLPQGKGLEIAGKLGGMEYADDLLIAAGATDQLRAAMARMQDQATRSGSVEKTFKIFDATTERGLARAGAAIDALAAKIGQRFTPAVNASAGVIARWVGGLVEGIERTEQAVKLAEKIGQGQALSKAETDALDADPKLKVETDRRVARERDAAERRAIVEEDGRTRAKAPAPAAPETTRPAGPPMPEAEDEAAVRAREATRAKLQGQIRDLDAEIAARKAGGYETTADRLRLRTLRKQYERMYPAEPAPPAPAPATASPKPVPEPAAPAPPVLPPVVDRPVTVPPALRPQPAPLPRPEPSPAAPQETKAPETKAPEARPPAPEAAPAARPSAPALPPVVDRPVTVPPALRPQPALPPRPEPSPAAAPETRPPEARPPAPEPPQAARPPAPILPPVVDRPVAVPPALRPQPAPPAKPEPPPAAAPAPETRPPAPLAPIGRQSELRDGVRVSLAAYHEEVDHSLARTERLVRDSTRRMRADLAITARVDLAALRYGAGDGARIQTASLGGTALGGGSIGVGPGGGGYGPGGYRAGSGSGGGGLRQAPGRFGGMVPGPPMAAERYGGAPVPGGGRPGAGTGLTGPRVGTPGGGMPDPGANPGAYKPVLDHIARAEGTANQPGGGYDTSLAYGKLLPGGTEQILSGKTLDEIDQIQTGMLRHPGNRWNSSALGRYQIVRKTLRGLRTKLGLRGDEKFDARMQDRLGAELARARGPNAQGLGQEWASLTGERGRQAAELMAQVPRDASTTPTGERPAAETGPAGAARAGANGQFDPLGGAARRHTSGYGMRQHPITGRWKHHDGIDMAAPGGTAVNAMQGGRVSRITRHGDVTVTHADGSTKTYRHMSPAGIREGQAVEAGGPLGRLRHKDPRSTGPHLHLEATDAQGRSYDPRPEVEAARRRPPDDTAVARRREGSPPEAAAEPAPVVQSPGRFGLAVPQRRPLPDARAPVDPARARRNADTPVTAAPPPERRLPQAGEPGAPSARFSEPARMEVRARGLGEAGGSMGGGRGGMGGGSGPAVQNFYGGFNEAEVARRATLERNRQVRRSFAGALGDLGPPG